MRAIPTDPRPLWVERVRLGDFAAIPAPFTWAQSDDLAMLLDGYAVTGGHERLSCIYTATMQVMGNGGAGSATALDLWLTLFYAHRGYRHQGTWPRGREREKLDRICESLRLALLALSPEQQSGFLGALRDGSTSEEARP
ncbi:hypothetical protein [Methylobacterium oxalidis]|uniref:Uncharacterized protein n=1 Tax=Methylobacterium oxalidis TaxID=944322 RepID=A0A512JAZ8_9HYPH|nr:hypothetical protein [Methylobacterium oxalidis]GEP07055.1 hypothetical protein MOX02_50930 [Methylobacterium oxalidis]GJE34979.1 hypothetical protein LDDCCGHA_5194 [Methylobacterium oxalidis]GLS67605.1 hypothetical protein GCM10007888_59890 [Methylobacterium oxalidis]